MKKVTIALSFAIITSLAFMACGSAGTPNAVTDTETSLTASVSEKEADAKEGKEGISFTSVGENIDVPKNADEAKEEPSKEGVRHDFPGLDEEGTYAYTLDYEVENGNLVTGKIELYFADELIYTVEDELIIDTGFLKYEDYDGDGEREILFVYYPHVNSMPLDEYVVLKNVNGLWKKLDTYVDKNGSNTFPIHVKYGAEPCKLAISCEGFDGVIDYDMTAHYEASAQKLEEEGGNADYINEFKRVLAGEGFSAGKEYGMIMPWGIWEVTSEEYEGEECIKALHGIAGPLERYDIIGSLYVYFRFDEKGKTKVVGLEFVDDLES